MKLVTKLGLGLVMLGAGVAHAGSYAKDVDAFGALHPAGMAVQISTSAVSLAYYADRHDYVVGATVSPYTTTDVAGVNSHSMTGSLFARKNMPLTTNVVLGYGLEAGAMFGEVNDVKMKNAYNVLAYASIEYAATQNVYLSASITPVKYETFKVADVKTKTMNYLKGGSVQLAYRFQ